MPMLCLTLMQFKEVGKLFDEGEIFSIFNGGGLKSNNFKTASSVSDMQNITAKMFNKQFRINADGVSEFSKAQIEAKANAIGLTDSLKDEVIAMASDATITDKLRTGKLTWAKAIDTAGDSINDVGDALIKSGKLGKKNGEILKKVIDQGDVKKTTQFMKDAINNVDGLADSFVKVETASKSSSIFSGAKDFGKGIVLSLKSFVATAGPYIAAIGAVVAAYKLLDYSQHAYTRAQEKATNAASEYQTERSNLESLNQSLGDTKSRLQELQDIKATRPLNLTEEAELSKLQTQNDELQRQVDLQEQLVEIKAKAAADAAVKAATTSQTYAESEEEKKGFWGKLMAYLSGNTQITSLDENGNMYTTTANLEWQKENDWDTTIPGQVKGIVKKYEDAKKTLAENQKTLLDKNNDLDDTTKKSIEEENLRLKSDIESYSSDLSEKSDIIQGWIEQSTDSNGVVAESARAYITDWKMALAEISGIGKTESEKALASLNAFFDGSIGKKAILNQLKEANKSGKDLEETLNMMGLSLSDLGIDNIKYLASYLQESAESASDAAKSVQDYATSVSDVKTATDSANQDSDWSTIQSAYKSAKDLLTEGKTGTDDFQSMASFLNPEKVKEYAEQGGKYTADAYQKAFEEIKATADRWFGDDETASMENFVNDFKDKGLWNVSTDAMGLWDIQKNFKTTAEAADKFGISVNAVETMLHGLEAYGYDFSDIMFSGEGLDKFKTSLESIKTIQKSLSDGASKDRLGKLIDNWDSEVQGYENDMSKLTEDKIVKIQFEYDLAQIQQEIDKLQRVADEGGDSQTWAELNATKKAYLEKAESRDGSHIADVSEYKSASDTVLAFQQQLKNASPEVKEQIQEQISAIYDLQKAANDAFADSGMAWDDWISSKDGKAIFSNMQSSITEIKKQIADALGIDVDDIKIDIDADTSKVDKAADDAKKTIEKKNPTMDFDAKFAGFDTKEVEEEMKNWSKKGSVDLNNRPQVKASTLADMGYKDTGNPNDTATVFSSSFSSEDGKKTVVVTPILPDGDVLEPGALEEYANEMLNGGEDSQGIEIRTYYGDDSIEKSNRYAEALHEVQQAYYLGDDAQKKALNSLSQYTDAQLKSIDLSDNQSSAMEDSMTSLMDSLGVGKESLSEFVDVLSDMGLIQINPEVNVEDNATDKIADIVSELTGIPKEQLTDIIANDNASPDVLNVLATLSGIPKEKLTEINASDGATGVITYVLSQILGIPESEVTNLIATDSVSNICSSATNAISNVPNSHNTSLNANDNASSQANSAASAVRGIPTSWFVTIGGGLSAAFTSAVAAAKNALASLGGGGHNLYGTAHLSGTLGGMYPIPKLSSRALAMGTLQDTSFLRDSWQTAQNEVALTGEKGPEIVIPPHSNRWYTVGDQGAEFAAIPAGSTVFNSKQSKELLTKGKTNSRAKGNPSLPGLPSSMAFLQGTAYRLGNYSGSGTSKNNYTGSSSNSSASSSYNSSPSNNNTNTSNTNSDTSSKAEETKETLDWIETELDRIKRNIDLVDKTASSTYKNWSKRNEALASELSQVSNELNVQQQAYDRYIQQANSVGLSEDWASKVRDGRIDIETITDSDLKDKISDYKTW